MISPDARTLPDFLIIGAEKAGTTWLHAALSQHPEVFLPANKEIHFFNERDSNLQIRDNFTRRGVGWYSEFFAGEAARRARARGEATPVYLSDPLAAGRIRETLPEARLLVSLRNPVDRAWSHYCMARSKNHIREPLKALIEARDARIIGRGFYAEQLLRWRELFPVEQVRVCVFERLVADPEGELASLAEFLGIDPAPFAEVAREPARNAAAGYRSAAFYNFAVGAARRLRETPMTAKLAAGLKASGLYGAIKRANRVARDNPPLPPGLRRRLADCYRADVAKLGALLPEGPPPWADFAEGGK